jgi:hypothetical protein
MADYIPLTSGNSTIGKISVDLETGHFEGELDQVLAHILKDGVLNKMLSVSFFMVTEDRRSLRSKEDVEAADRQMVEFRTYLKEHES